MRRAPGAAPTSRLPSTASKLRWAIDELQGDLPRSGTYSPGGFETRPDCQPKVSRSQHIQRLPPELLEAKRRPCCWLGCIHRKDKELSPSVRWVLSIRSKASK